MPPAPPVGRTVGAGIVLVGPAGPVGKLLEVEAAGSVLDGAVVALIAPGSEALPSPHAAVLSVQQVTNHAWRAVQVGIRNGSVPWGFR
jgi:hypothetical protein